jgi:hypothetical protein
LAIDELLNTPAAAGNRARKANAQTAPVDIGALEAELRQFLEDAYAQHYFEE